MKLTATLIIALALSTAAVSGKVKAIILEKSHLRYVVESATSLSTHEFRRITVLSEDGYEKAVYYDYYDSFRKIKSIQYTVFDANGKRVKKLVKSDALDVMLNNSYEINDARLLVLEPQYRNYPFTVEIEVEVVYKSYLGLPVWIPRSSPDMEVKEASLTLECRPDFKFASRELNGIAKPQVSSSGLNTAFHWTVKNLPAQDKPLTRRSFMDDQPRVHLAPLEFNFGNYSGTFDSWTSFGDWYLRVNEGRDQLNDETKKELDKLKAGFDGDRTGLITAVYRYMQSRTRYISIQLGIGGYQSLPAATVEKNGYGDCKALTNYMKSMLGYLGIPSSFVLVNAGRDVPDILEDFPSNQFNHVFLAVKNHTDTLWFECTSQSAPPAFLGTFTDDRHALWIEKNGSRVIRTPTYGPTNNTRSSKAVVTLSESGDAVIKIDMKQTGKFFDEAMMLEHAGTGQVQAWNHRKFPYKDFNVTTFTHSVPDPGLPLLELHYELNVRSLATSVGDRMVIPSGILSSIENEIQSDPLNRRAEVRRAFTLEENIQIDVPATFRIENLPEPRKEDLAFGSMEISFLVDDGRIQIQKKVIVEKSVWDQSRWVEFQESLKKVKSSEQARIILTSRT